MDQPSSFIERVDPRVRIVATVAFSVLVAVAGRFPVLGMALAVAGLAAGLAGLGPIAVVKRLVPVNLFMLVLLLLLPLTADGPTTARLGPVSYSVDGLMLALAITLKGNAIVLALMALVGTMEDTTLGHALAHLRLPDKLIHLLLFTVRYIHVLKREYLRLTDAMRMRAFRPRMNRHTYRGYAHLVGMLLVRSFDRSERIVAAMKCRGFRGRFYLLDHFSSSPRDLYFSIAGSMLLLTMALAEWL